MRDGTALLKAGHQSPRQVVRDGTALLKAGHQRSRQVVRDGTAGLLREYCLIDEIEVFTSFLPET